MASSYLSPSLQYQQTTAEIGANTTKSTAQAKASYEDELGDIDVWAAETAANDAKAAADKSYSALSSMGSRAVGGGTFNSLVSGRGRINLGSVSGGLAAANAAKLADTKKKDAAGDLAAQTQYYATAGAADQGVAQTKLTTESAANNGELIGSSFGVNIYRRIDPVTGQLQYGTSSNGSSVQWKYDL
jgi:hypothetical protein